MLSSMIAEMMARKGAARGKAHVPGIGRGMVDSLWGDGLGDTHLAFIVVGVVLRGFGNWRCDVRLIQKAFLETDVARHDETVLFWNP